MSFGLSGLKQAALSLFIIAGTSLFSHASNPDPTWLIDKISIHGNSKTKNFIIIRELTFTVGDSLNAEDLKLSTAKSTENLLRLSLFHFVNIKILPDEKRQTAEIVIEVVERWYIWLWPVFEISDRNFNSWLKNGDLSRISFGAFLQQENFRGRHEKLHIRAKFGYQQQVALLYEIPYLNQKKTLGAGVNVSAGRERETAYNTAFDKLQYYRTDYFLRKVIEASVFLLYRPQIHLSHTFSAGFGQFFLSDSLLHLNDKYTGVDKEKTFIPEIEYLLKADYRDNRGYPLKGWYADVLINGFGLMPESDVHFYTLRTSARLHVPLENRWYSAYEVSTKFSTSGTKPWFLNQALGYDRDYVRGYEYNVIDGDNFLLLKSNIRFALIPERIYNFPGVNLKQFNTIPYSLYLGIFADAGLVWPEIKPSTNRLPGKILGGLGIGLDYATYYDKVLRLEFSVNRERKAGFFVHFMAAI